MKSKPKHLAKRILVFLLTLSILWSESSFVSLAQTINGETTESFQGINYEEPSDEPEAEITGTTEEPAESGEPEGDQADPEDGLGDSEGDQSDPDDSLVDTEEDPEKEPSEEPSEEPDEEPVETTEDAEEPEDSEEPSEAVESGEVNYYAETIAAEKLAFRIGNEESDWDEVSDWNGETVPRDSVIKIYNNDEGNPGYLTQDDVQDIIWYVKWIVGVDDPNNEFFETHRGTELVLQHFFMPVDFELKVEITSNDGEKYEMKLDRVQASATVPADVELAGTALPGYKLFLTDDDKHEDIDGGYIFLRADDIEEKNAVIVRWGDDSYYDIADADNGKYIYLKYVVKDADGNKTFYKTEPVYVGYHMGDDVTEDEQKANAKLLQEDIGRAAEDASETGERQWVNIPAGVQIMTDADNPIILYDGVTLNSEADTDMDRERGSVPAIIGSIQVKKYKTEAGAKPVGEVRIENLFLSSCTNGTVIDASSDVCVVLNNCRFDINENAALLKVSKDNYAGTEINNSIAYFSKGGTLLSMKEDSSMPSVFKLGNTDLRVKIIVNDEDGNVEDSNVAMLNAPAGVKWNVEGLRPADMNSLVKLTPGNPVNVINNVFWDDDNGWTSNSKELTLDSAYNYFISYILADRSSFCDADAKIIVETNDNPAGKYEVTLIPEPDGWENFRPYAVTGTYAAGEGDYNNLLPENYLNYIVVDVNQREGFPFGALVGKDIDLSGNNGNFVVMQYHKDKSVETVASVSSGSDGALNVYKKANSGFANIESLGNGKYKLLVNTRVKGENVEEPIVLAVYADAGAAGAKLSVYEEETYFDGENDITEEVLSDGKIITYGADKKVYFRLNEGVVSNAFTPKDGAFEIVSGGYTVPDGKNISKEVSENGAELVLTIPEGTYGTLTVMAHYKGSASDKATDFTYTLQLTSIDNVKGVTVENINSGKQYYGTAYFDIHSSAAKPFISVKSRNGENNRYNLKVISSSLSGTTVTVQYMLDLRSENGEAWESFALNPPCLLVETVAGTCEIYLNSGEDKLSFEKDGARYLFDKIEGKDEVVFIGALVVDGNIFYTPEGATLEIPAEVPEKTEEGVKKYAVTAMAEGCLNNIYDYGNRVYEPNVVIIPASVTDIRVPMVTDKGYSYLKQIVVDDGNPVYCTYGTKEDFDKTDRDHRNWHDYCALYKRNSDGTTELVEIASDWGEHLSWRDDAVWTDDTYNLDFSSIRGFICENSTKGYQILNGNDRILVKIDDNSVTLIKVLEKMATGMAVVIPEDVTNINARALENIAVDTLVLPDSLKSWDGGLTKAKNIYVYNKDTKVNPVSKIDSSVTGVTFYGFTDKDGSSELKKWVDSPEGKARKYKFVAMKETGAKVDYTVTTLRKPVMSYKGIEYYEVNIGERLTPDFDFDIVSKVINGYPGKTDVCVKVVGVDLPGNNSEYAKAANEFGAPFWGEDGLEWIEAENPGVVEVKIMKGEDEVKTAYFAVRPEWTNDMAIFEGVENPWYGLDIELGETGTFFLPVDDKLTEGAIQEYEALGVLRVKLEATIVDEKAVEGHDKAWNIERVPNVDKPAGGEVTDGEGLDGEDPDGEGSDGEDPDDENPTDKEPARITYNFTPQLCKAENGEIIGGGGTLFDIDLFGETHVSTWCATNNLGTASWFSIEESNIIMNTGAKKNVELPTAITVSYPERLPDGFDPSNVKPEDIGNSIAGQKGPGYLSYDEDMEIWTILEDKSDLTFGVEKYGIIFCEVVSGKDIVDAEIVERDNGWTSSSLRLTAKKVGKAQIRLYSKYLWTEEFITVAVGKENEELIQSFSLNLWDGDGVQVLDSSSDPEYFRNVDKYKFAWRMDEEAIWKAEIPVSNIVDKTKEPVNGKYPEVPSAKLKWTVSDSNLAELVYGDTSDKKKVTGIRLKGEGTVLISATVQDTNAATVNMLFTVKDVKPRLYNTDASLDTYKKDGKAEYVFALPENVGVEKAELKSVSVNNNDVNANKFGLNLEGFEVWEYNEEKEQDELSYVVNDKVSVGIKDDSLAAGTYTLKFAVTSTYYVDVDEGEGGEEAENPDNPDNNEPANQADESKNITGTYDYTVTLKLTRTEPKVTVTAADAIDLSVLSKRESALTVTVGDVVNGKNTEIVFDKGDTLTKSFAEYFELVKSGSDTEESCVYSIRFTKNNGKTAADIAKLFNGKKIKLQVKSADYKNFSTTAEVSFKITATTPAIKIDGGGKVTVNTTDFTGYEGRENGYGVYTAKTSYTLTDEFSLVDDAGNEVNIIKMDIAAKQAAYKDMITFRKEGDRIIAMVDPRVPKGTYTFTWTPTVRAFSSGTADNIFTKISLKSQKISVVVTTSTAKAALSSTKLVLDKNYKYTEAETCLLFDENQIQSLYGSSYYFEGNDGAQYERAQKIQDSITLVKAPKGVTAENSKVKFRVEYDHIYAYVDETPNAGKDSAAAVTGEYKYSVTPYVMVSGGWNDEEGEWHNVYAPMALAPINFSVQVTDNKLPKATLSQSTVTIDNYGGSNVFIKWNINGNYQYIAGPDGDGVQWNVTKDKDAVYYSSGSSDEYPDVYLEGDFIRVSTSDSTLKGTYKISVAPTVVLDSTWIPDKGSEADSGEGESAINADEGEDSGEGGEPKFIEIRNEKTLPSVTLTVKVNSSRPTVKLGKSKLTVSSSYPGVKDTDENGWFVNVPAEAVTEIDTSNGYAIGNIEVKASDNKAKALQENVKTKITFSEGKYDWGGLHRLAAVPTAETPNGTYNFLIYAKLYTGDYVRDEEGNEIVDENGNKTPVYGAALEPVKLTVVVNNKKPTFKLSASKILLPAGREGRVDITLQGQTDLVSGIKEKTEYLVKENGKWILKKVESSEASAPADAYVRLDTADDGRITVTSLGKNDNVKNAKVTYTQETCLIGNEGSDGKKSYNAPYSYSLTFNLTTADPNAVLSAANNTITVNKDYDVWSQEGNKVKLTLNNGEKVECQIEDTNPEGKKNVIELERINEESDAYGITYKAFFKTDKVEPGEYKFKLTPKVIGGKALSPVTLTVKVIEVTDKLLTVTASQKSVTINKLDTRGNTWQQIHLKPSLSYANVYYEMAITKAPAGVDPKNIWFFPEGCNIEGEGDITLGSTDTGIPDGSYTLTVKPYTWVAGKRKELKKIDITVKVESPKLTAAVQSPKVTVDVAASGSSVYTRNSIMLTGTNADYVRRLNWNWELTKKPKGAEDNELWLEDRWDEYDNWNDGKDIYICWGNKNQYDGSRYVNVTPGVYEFTLTPTGVETHNGDVRVLTPAPVKLTVTVKNSMPAVKYGKTGSKMNMAFMNEDNTFITLSDTSWHLENVDAVMTSWPTGAGEEDKSGLSINWEGNRLRVRGSEKVKEGTYTFTLTPKAVKNGIEMPLKEQKYTVTVKNEIPNVKASSAKLTCNVLYTGKYWFGDNKKQQLKLTLDKNYGSSHFEDCKITFTGKAAQQADADKMDWQFNSWDGTVAVRLKEGRVVSTGNYMFELTPSIRSDVTGVKMTLKPVKITVTVENKEIKATAKASGSIDLLNRDGTGITYTVTLSDKDADVIERIEIDDFGYYVESDEKDPAKVIVKLRDDDNKWGAMSTKKYYETRLAVHTRYGMTYYVPIKIKPTQSALTIKADAVTLYKQATYDTAAVTVIRASVKGKPFDVKFTWHDFDEYGNGRLATGNPDFKAFLIDAVDPERDENGNLIAEFSDSTKVKIVFATENAKGKYKAGSEVTVPIYVNVFNMADHTRNTVKVNVKVKIQN